MLSEMMPIPSEKAVSANVPVDGDGQDTTKSGEWCVWALQHFWTNWTRESWEIYLMEFLREPQLHKKMSPGRFVKLVEEEEYRLVAFLGYMAGDVIEEPCDHCESNGFFTQCVYVSWFPGTPCMNCVWPNKRERCSFCELLTRFRTLE